MRHLASRHAQSGVTLVIGLIMLVLITLVVTTAFSLSTTNLRSVGNMQVREEALAAANIAIEMEVGSPFTNAPAAVTDRDIDIDDDGEMDYRVNIATPVCVRATQAINESLSSLYLPAGMTSLPFWNTIWDFDATATDLHGSGATVQLHQGVRVLLSEAQKNAVCP